jgi:hypothetical protein
MNLCQLERDISKTRGFRSKLVRTLAKFCRPKINHMLAVWSMYVTAKMMLKKKNWTPVGGRKWWRKGIRR